MKTVVKMENLETKKEKPAHTIHLITSSVSDTFDTPLYPCAQSG